MSSIPAHKPLGIGLIVLLGSLTATGPMSIDFYLPGLPALAEEFGASPAAAQGTVAAFFIGIASAQLVWGPLGDRYGRKWPMVVGMGGYVVASLACMVAPTIATLMLARFVQGLFGCGPMVLPRAVVRDLADAQTGARIFSALTAVMGIAPILGPSLGALVIDSSGWRACFGILAVLGLVCLAATVLALPETLRHDAIRPRSIAQAATGYAAIASNRSFQGYALTGSFAFAALFANVSSVAFIFMRGPQGGFGLSVGEFGLLFGGLAFCVITAAASNGFLLRRFTFDRMLRIAVPLAAIAGLVMVASTQVAPGSFWAAVLPLGFVLGSVGLLFGNTAAGALSAEAQRAGSASALLGMTQNLIGALGAVAAGLVHDGTARPLALVMAAATLAGLLCFVLLKPWRRSR